MQVRPVSSEALAISFTRDAMLFLLTVIFTMTLAPINGDYNVYLVHMNFTNGLAMNRKLLDIHQMKTAD